MRIAIATTGRFHVLDLARELAALGHHVLFYSTVPRKRALRFGLPATSHRGLLFWLAPLLVAQRFGGAWIGRLVNPLILMFTDWLIAWRLEPCDVFIGMSGLCVRSAQTARQRFGAKIFIERGSRHILSQKKILDDIKRMSPDAQTVPKYALRLHLASTTLADVVVVPARHAAESFVEAGFPIERIFRNPYGVDLSMFKPTPAPTNNIPTVITVGSWSYRKGCDLLTEAIASFGGRVRLLHVGPIGDVSLPEKVWFQHQDPVPQWQLSHWYSKAHVFALASREEGLSLVQAQALASGLPVVCSDRTGGEDLAMLLGLEAGIFIVPHDDSKALADSILKSLEWAEAHFPSGTPRDLLAEKRELLSWRAYAQRYEGRLM